MIYTIKRDEQHPRPYHMGTPPPRPRDFFGARQQIPKEDCVRELDRSKDLSYIQFTQDFMQSICLASTFVWLYAALPDL